MSSLLMLIEQRDQRDDLDTVETEVHRMKFAQCAANQTRLIACFLVGLGSAAVLPAEQDAQKTLQGQKMQVAIDPATALARVADEIERCNTLNKADETYERANCLLLESMQHLQTGNRKAAMGALDQCLSLLDHLQDPLGEALVHQTAAQVATAFGDRTRAATHLDSALAALDRLKTSTTPVRFDLMKLQGKMFGLPPEYFAQFDQLETLSQSVGPLLADLLRPNIAAANEQLTTSGNRDPSALQDPGLDPKLDPTSPDFLQGGVDQARSETIENRDRADAQGDAIGAWTKDFQAGFMAFLASDFEEAARSFERNVHHADELPLDPTGRELRRVTATCLLGITYDTLGLSSRAEELFQETRERAQKSGSEDLIALAEITTATFQAVRGGKVEVEKVQKMIDEYSTRSGRQLSSSERQLLETMVALMATMGGTEDEKTSFSQLPEAMSGNPTEPSLRAQQLFMRGAQAFQAGKYDEALHFFQEARSTFENLGLRDLELVALLLETSTHASLFDASALAGKANQAHLQAALTLSLQAVTQYDSMLEHVKVDDLLSRFTGERIGVYKVAMALLAVAGRQAEAFAIAERARARSLLNLLGNHKPKMIHGVEPDLLEGLEKHRREITQLEQRPLPEDLAERRELGTRLQTARRDYEKLLTSAKLANPEYASFLRSDPLSVETLQEEVLDADTTLVAYFDFGESFLVWMIDREHFAMKKIDLDPSEGTLDRRVAYLMDLIESRESEEEVARVAGELHQRLIEPLLPEIRHQRWIIVPHGALHALPFAALRNPKTGRYLIEDYALSYAPSASVLGFLEDKVTPIDGKVLVLGNPITDMEPLPAAEEEARTVAQLFATEARIGKSATETAVRQEGKSVDLLHLATHGVFHPKTPRFSHIALAKDELQDGQLNVHEIFDEIDLSAANLVVLSACQTALGERTRGDDIIGLTRAFLYAGSPTVISTLWSIADEASVRLIQTFYCRLLEGTAVDHALRAAQIDLMVQERYAHPYFWAAFQVNGYPDTRWLIESSDPNSKRSQLCR